MKLLHYLPAIASLLLIACHNTPVKSEAPAQTLDTPFADAKSSNPGLTTDTVNPSENGDEWLSRYVLVADTGSNYFALQKQMVAQSNLSGIRIYSKRRFYDVKKNLIRLPDNDDDEIYAGDYFPRRDNNEYFSIEYLNVYKADAKEKTMAIIAGILPIKSWRR